MPQLRQYHPGFLFFVLHNLCTESTKHPLVQLPHGMSKSVTVIVLGYNVYNVSNVVYVFYLTLCTYRQIFPSFVLP